MQKLTTAFILLSSLCAAQAATLEKFTPGSLDSVFDGSGKALTADFSGAHIPSFTLPEKGMTNFFGASGIPGEMPLQDYEAGKVGEALQLLAKTPIGKQLAPLVRNKDIKIKWMPGGQDNARAKPPEDDGTGAVIYLNFEKRAQILNPKYLALLLAHELSHQDDFFSCTNKMEEGGTMHLLTEIKSLTSAAAAYKQLDALGLMPEKESGAETYEIQLIRYYSVFYNYKNLGQGEWGLPPGHHDYYFFKLDAIDGLSYSDHWRMMMSAREKGGLTFLPAVRNQYEELRNASPTMGKPGFLDFKKKKEYQADLQLMQNLERTGNVLKPPKPVPPATQPQPVNPPQNNGGSAGNDNGNPGGSDGGYQQPGNGGNPQLPGWAQNPNWDGSFKVLK